MTDTASAAPSDAEIIALADETRTGEPGRDGYILPISFARAVLAKWGTPAPVEAEPYGWHYWNIAGTSVLHLGRSNKLDADIAASKKHPEAHHVVPLYATPQPTQAREIEGLRKDAARYRWLRHGDNDEKVLKTYTSRPSKPGEPTMFLPRNGELDRLIDTARATQEGKK